MGPGMRICCLTAGRPYSPRGEDSAFSGARLEPEGPLSSPFFSISPHSPPFFSISPHFPPFPDPSTPWGGSGDWSPGRARVGWGGGWAVRGTPTPIYLKMIATTR